MNRFYLIAVLLVVVLSGCDDSTPNSSTETPAPPAPTAVADCCQCASRGTSTTPSLPVACVTGTTTQSACDSTCGNNIGGLMTGSCSDGIRCQ